MPKHTANRKPIQSTSYIYALIDPRDDKVFYVGQSVNPEGRYFAHCGDGRYFYEYPERLGTEPGKLKWERIYYILKDGKRPTLKILEEVAVEDATAREVYWFNFYRKQGCEMLNADMPKYPSGVMPLRHKLASGHDKLGRQRVLLQMTNHLCDELFLLPPTDRMLHFISIIRQLETQLSPDEFDTQLAELVAILERRKRLGGWG